jgi:hypothetical protein
MCHTSVEKFQLCPACGDLLERRQQLMQEWADYCASPMQSGEIVPMRGV